METASQRIPPSKLTRPRSVKEPRAYPLDCLIVQPVGCLYPDRKGYSPSRPPVQSADVLPGGVAVGLKPKSAIRQLSIEGESPVQNTREVASSVTLLRSDRGGAAILRLGWNPYLTAMVTA